jgi:UDP-N-acetylmuramate-alanine ligase
MNISELKTAYFLGIGGIGMSALARYFHRKGVHVMGYDRTSTALTTELELDETSKKTISSAMGTQPKTKSTTLYWSKTFMSSEAGGDLNRKLNGLQGQIPWISTLQEIYRRLTESIRRKLYR